MSEHFDRTGDATRDHFFGDLYFETTAELLTKAMTRTEASVIARLLLMKEQESYLDLGCGHGRHVEMLRGEGFGRVYGVDRSLAYLQRGAVDQRRNRGSSIESPHVNGDLRSLPFASAVFAGAYSWYSGLFLFEEETNLQVLREVARILKPGGLLLHHGANPQRLAAEPVARHAGRTRSGARVEELATFDPESGRESLCRRLTRPDGVVLEGSWLVHHYRPEELELLLPEAGLALEGFFDESGGLFDPSTSIDMIAMASRYT